MKITVDENYGADVDGNRGIRQEFYELEDTEEERQEIAEILYEAFANGCGLTGGATIEYKGIEIEVEIEDYHQELKKMLVEDIELDEEDIVCIAQEMEDFNLIADWKKNKDKVSEEQFVLVGKYAFNKLNFDKFKELLERSIGNSLGDSYVKSKWEAFKMNMLSFLVSYKELTREILKEIYKTNYKG